MFFVERPNWRPCLRRHSSSLSAKPFGRRLPRFPLCEFLSRAHQHSTKRNSPANAGLCLSVDRGSRRLSWRGGRGQAACLAPFFLRWKRRRDLIPTHGRSPWRGSPSKAGHIGLLRLPGRGSGEPAHESSRHIQGVLDVGFAISDISGPALRHEGRKKAAGDAKFYVSGHWISEAPSVKGLHIEALHRRLARAGICLGSQILNRAGAA